MERVLRKSPSSARCQHHKHRSGIGSNSDVDLIATASPRQALVVTVDSRSDGRWWQLHRLRRNERDDIHTRSDARCRSYLRNQHAGRGAAACRLPALRVGPWCAR